MSFISQRIPYRQTNSFSSIVLDYVDQTESLKPFFSNPPTFAGLQKAIEERKNFNTDRHTLVSQLKEQYKNTDHPEAVKNNLDHLLKENTFTITTAHQPAIFTGPLYYIYKTLHAIQLAAHLNKVSPENHFVPVFYIGSEDADLDELGYVYIGGEKLEWETKQQGAVGRMKIDKQLISLIDRMEGQVSILPHGNEIVSMVKKYYHIGTDIQTATFKFLNELFGEFGLIVLLPDNAALKNNLQPIFEDDLLNQAASEIVATTSNKLSKHYKVQASPREINLFYLKDDLRNRIVFTDSRFHIHNTTISFSKGEMLQELKDHPERFSPNVILRGLYQETILPNIAFIGGGGEVAYWMQLKDLFSHYKVPFPVLILRNSFLLVEKKWQEKMARLNLTLDDFFLTENEIVNKLVARETSNNIKLNGELQAAEKLYDVFKKQAGLIDTTLTGHVEALKKQSIGKLMELEKKMLRAEKRKFADQQRQIHSIKNHLFPSNGLQERIDNFIPYYAKWGKEFIQQLYENSISLEQEFVILTEK